MKKDRRGINSASKPSGDGCVECLASPKGWSLHPRWCAEYGHIGCCDGSPSQHASKHAADMASDHSQLPFSRRLFRRSVSSVTCQRANNRH